MADDQQPKKEEVSVADLLSLWGGAGGGSSPKPPPAVQPPKPTPTPVPMPASAPASRPISPPPPVPAPEPKKVAPPPPQPAPEPKKIPPPLRPQPKEESLPPQPQPKEEFLPPPPPPRPQPKEEPEPVLPPVQPKEIIEGEVVKSETLLDEDDGGFGGQMDEFLTELNLSRKHIFYGIGCVAIIIVLVFAGIFGYKYFKNRKQNLQPAEIIAEKTEPVAKIETGISTTSEIGKKLDTESIGETGIYAVISVGSELQSGTSLANYILTFKRIQNAYEVDINQLLNQAVDRRGRLNAHLALLSKLFSEGSLINQKMKEEMDAIKIKYEDSKKEQSTDDVNFFEQLKTFNAQTAEDILNHFITVSRDIVELRARFKALQKIRLYYEYALPRLLARVKDIELNAEPLILGLKIYDVKGSDLKLIIPVENQTGVSGSGFESLDNTQGGQSSFFINPANVSTGHDYVTTPGGGL